MSHPDLLAPDDASFLGDVVLRALRPVALALALLYTLYALSFLAASRGEPHAVGNGLDCAASAALLGALAWGAPRWAWTRRLPHVAATLACSVVLYNTLGLLAQTHQPRQTSNLMLLVVGVGALMLSWTWALVLDGAAVVGWVVVAAAGPPDPDWEHFGFALLSALVLSTVVLHVRRRHLQQLEVAQAQLRDLSLVDPLTGLHNRRGLMHLAGHALNAADRAGQAVTVLFVDVDGLKAVNDLDGHAAGDLALQQTARALRAGVRDSDICARLGGDEFCVLMPGGVPDVRLVADRIRDHLLAIAGTPGAPPRFGVSVGATTCPPRSACSVEELIERADAAMYVDKQAKHERMAAQSG